MIETSALPEAVKSGLAASAYKSAELRRAEKVITNENDAEPAYELVLAQGKNVTEVVFDKSGKITKEEKHGK